MQKFMTVNLHQKVYIKFILNSKYLPLILRSYENLKNVKSSKTYILFTVCNKKNIMITTEKN